jgi:hypothetical protein
MDTGFSKPIQGVRNVGKGLSKGGVALVGVDVAMSGKIKTSHFGTMGINYLLGNGAVGLGGIIDNATGTIEMYEGLY